MTQSASAALWLKAKSNGSNGTRGTAMTIDRTQSFLAAALVFALASVSADAQQVPIPTTAAEVPGPAPGMAMSKAYVETVGRMAYLWGWALVDNANRHAAF